MGGVSPEESSSTTLKMKAAGSSETFIILPANLASFTASPMETSAHRLVTFAWQLTILVGSSVNDELLRN